VVKVGSSSLRAPDGGLDRGTARALVDQVAAVRALGVEVVLVSSGAVAAGLAPLGMRARPADLPGLQAAASVGQGLLLHTYQEAFAARGLACGQVLLTPDDVVHRPRFLNARHTFDRLLALGAVPVVNENDAVATDELRFGDNDRLAALVASKLEAARVAAVSGAHTVIANARRPGVVPAAVDGEEVGTWFPPARRRPDSRKLWIAFALTPRGRVEVDAGAVRALTERGSSLLAAGVVGASGDFAAGDPVDVVGPDQRLVARGLVAYERDDLLRVRGRSSEEVVRALGPAARPEVIHRDRLVVVT